MPPARPGATTNICMWGLLVLVWRMMGFDECSACNTDHARTPGRVLQSHTADLGAGSSVTQQFMPESGFLKRTNKQTNNPLTPELFRPTLTDRYHTCTKAPHGQPLHTGLGGTGTGL